MTTMEILNRRQLQIKGGYPLLRLQKSLTYVLLFSVILGSIFQINVGQASAAPVRSDASKSKIQFDQVLENHRVSPDFLQGELDKGYSLQDVKKALELSKANAVSYENSIGKISPQPVNLSKGAKSTITSDYKDTVFLSASTDSMTTATVGANYSYVDTKPESAPYTVSLDHESISTLTGGLSFHQTDLFLPGRNGLSFSLTRTYDSDASQFTLLETDATGTNSTQGIPYNEKMFPIGKGWTWNIPSIEYSNGKKYVHLVEKGLYELVGTSLKGYPWSDLTYSADSSVTVNGVPSVDKIKTLEGISFYFSDEGRLLQISDPYQNKTQFTYTSHPDYGIVLQRITDAIGNVIQINFTKENVTLTKGTEVVTYYKTVQNGKELLSRVIDQAGRETTYDYSIKAARFSLTGTTPSADNPYALLVGIRHPTGAKTLYGYEATPVTRYIEENAVNQVYRVASRKDQITYNNGTTEDKNAKTITYTGDPGSSYSSDLTYTITINDGIQTTAFENKKDYIDANTSPAFYNMKVVRTAGSQQQTTTYTYDEARRWYWPVTETSQSKNLLTNGSSPLITSSRSYNDYANVVAEIDPQGARTDYTYDPTSHLLTTMIKALSSTQKQFTKYTRNAQGSITGVEVRENNDTGRIVQQIFYENFDPYGNATRIRVKDNGRDLTTDTTFGAAHQYAFPTSQTQRATNVDGVVETYTTSFLFNTSSGKLKEYVDGRSNKTTYEYDILGRVSKVVHPDNTNYSILYDDFSNQITMRDETGVTTYLRWNPLGWKTDAGFILHDAFQAKEKYGYDAFGRVQWTEDALGNRTTYEYNDPWGRQSAVIDPLLNRSTISYNDQLLTKTETDAEQVAFEMKYDIMGREKEKYEIKGSTRTLLSSVVYDYAGNMVEAIDAKTKKTIYGYDVLGRLISVTNPLSETTSYEYSLAGNLIQIIHPDLNTISKMYDDLGRLIKETDSNARFEKIYYDANGNRTKLIDRNGQQFTYSYTPKDQLEYKYITGNAAETVHFQYDSAGRRLSMADATGTTGYEYDNSTGELKKVTFPDGRTLSYDYDVQGNRKQMTDPFGFNVYYEYDSLHRLSSVGSALNDPDAEYTYFKNGLLASVQQKNGISLNYTYDGLRLDTLTHRKSDGTILYSFDYNYDANNNIRQITSNGQTENFTYDDVNRIKTSSILNQSFTYNNRGNRVTFSSQNPPEPPDATYTFNQRDQLSDVTLRSGESVSYKYNGDGLLYERNESGVATRFYYDGIDLIAEGEARNEITLITRYIRGNNLVALQKDSLEKGYYLQNGHGDIIEIRDHSGNTALNQYTYDIWGNPLRSQEVIENSFMYSGEYWDKKSGLQYLQSRWYDPSVGRFISEDSYEGDITNPLSLNLYTYVYNNPLRYTDPSGHIPRFEADSGATWYPSEADSVREDYLTEVLAVPFIAGAIVYSPAVLAALEVEAMGTTLPSVSANGLTMFGIGAAKVWGWAKGLFGKGKGETASKSGSLKLDLQMFGVERKTSQTFGQPIETVYGGQKVKLRVDAEPDGNKIQIQAGKGKDSTVDIRINPNLPLETQIPKNLRKSLSEGQYKDLLKNLQKAVDYLK
jgi:RHS repeat-associated protein